MSGICRRRRVCPASIDVDAQCCSESRPNRVRRAGLNPSLDHEARRTYYPSRGHSAICRQEGSPPGHTDKSNGSSHPGAETWHMISFHSPLLPLPAGPSPKEHASRAGRDPGPWNLDGAWSGAPAAPPADHRVEQVQTSCHGAFHGIRADPRVRSPSSSRGILLIILTSCSTVPVQ